MVQEKAVFENLTDAPPINGVFDADSLWRQLDDEQLELWLGDYIWFSDFAEPEYRAECARTCDELIVECSLRERHDMIRRAWARLARGARGKA